MSDYIEKESTIWLGQPPQDVTDGNDVLFQTFLSNENCEGEKEGLDDVIDDWYLPGTISSIVHEFTITSMIQDMIDYNSILVPEEDVSDDEIYFDEELETTVCNLKQELLKAIKTLDRIQYL